MRAPRRVAIVHYWLVGMRGGERVLERLIHLFPQADIFTHVYVPERVSAAIRARPVRTSFIQRLPGAARHYQKYLPLMPMALEQLDLRGYDLVISSESGPAKGVIAAPDALHVCYCHSPMRYLWDHYHDYRESAGGLARAAMPWMFHRLRGWDVTSAARVDRFVANSGFIRQRIARAWRRDADIVHPPVAVDLFAPAAQRDAHYLWVGQMTPYKRADVALETFNRLGLPLLMIGEGEMLETLRRRARPNVTILPRVDLAGLTRAYARSRALIFTAEEDFGIVPVEAMASGTPVLAYGRGGARDSVVADVTGRFFDAQTADCLVDAVEALEQWLPHFDPLAAVAHARRFAPERFDEGMMRVIGAAAGQAETTAREWQAPVREPEVLA
ncbi:glycosyltransferase [Sphingomonas profundi]|uniref:glycosyltransferase n=1 Tax=Alterirhizorhabdus profundi TaxID=2681549 RepID=UPI0012E82D30|nr:glycosyltransferase [Sphingomonas profundi]